MEIADLPAINNDHVVDAPRGLIYLSANDGHLYVAPIAGGTATQVSSDSSRYHFLHGVVPTAPPWRSSISRGATSPRPGGSL